MAVDSAHTTGLATGKLVGDGGLPSDILVGYRDTLVTSRITDPGAGLDRMGFGKCICRSVRLYLAVYNGRVPLLDELDRTIDVVH